MLMVQTKIASRIRFPKSKETHSVSKNAPPGEKKLETFIFLKFTWPMENSEFFFLSRT